LVDDRFLLPVPRRHATVADELCAGGVSGCVRGEKEDEVRVVTVENDKNFDTRHSSEEVAKNLSRHGIKVTLETVNAAGRPVGEVLRTAAVACKTDLLVMGAYGHSRLREFILGGATQSLLSAAPLPVLFSH